MFPEYAHLAAFPCARLVGEQLRNQEVDKEIGVLLLPHCEAMLRAENWETLTVGSVQMSQIVLQVGHVSEEQFPRIKRFLSVKGYHNSQVQGGKLIIRRVLEIND